MPLKDVRDQAPVVYDLDADDRIVRVEGPWNDFALTNNSPEIRQDDYLSDRVVGRRLFDFVGGDQTRIFLSTLFNSTRVLQRVRDVDYRCDSFGQKRFMQMRIEPLRDRSLRLTHTLMRVESMNHPFAFVEDAVADHDSGSRCSICNRVQVSGAWIEPDDRATRGLPQPFRVTHTVCPVCESLI